MIGTLAERRAYFDRKYPVWREKTLYMLLRDTAADFQDKPYIIAGSRQITYAQTLLEADRYAAALYQAGIRAGTHVAVLMTNCPEFLFLTYALAKIGAVKIPLSFKIKDTELQFYLNSAQAEVLLTMPVPSQTVRNGSRFLRQVYVLDPASGAPEYAAWQQLLADSAQTQVPVFFDAHAVCDIMYTSGSTGHPKGAMHTHDETLRVTYATAYTRGYEEGRRQYLSLPLFHGFAYWEAALSLPFCGGCMVLEEYFNAARAIALIERYRVDEILGVPYMFLSILEAPELDAADLSSLHAAYVGATASPDWVWRAINEKLHIYDVINAFGGTELTGSTVMTQATDPIEIPMTRVGKLKDCGCAGLTEYGGRLAEYKTVQLSDRRTPAKPNEPGELCSRGVMFQGYFNEPEATRRAIDEDGWYHSGDVGYIDENGYIVLKGRSNDSYKMNGELVCPQFLDRQITQAEHVAAVEVVGIPDAKLNAVGAAFVDLTEDTPENRQSVINWCCEHLGKFEIPKYFIFRPKNAWILTDSGKVPKFRMRELAIELLAAGGSEIVEVTKSKRKGCVSRQEREYAI